MKKQPFSYYMELLNREDLLESTLMPFSAMDETVDMLTYDTRELKEGCRAIFVCKGAHFKPEYVEYAMTHGAVAYISEKDYGEYPHIIVSDIRRAMAILAKEFYEDAPNRLYTVGITGTKGKSTTSYFLRAILNACFEAEKKPRTGIISTIDIEDGSGPRPALMTTPEAMELYRICDTAVHHGLKHMIIESSSQALKYGRVTGVNFKIGCITTISPDHISPVEHPDFEDYFASKMKIFNQCEVAVINSGAADPNLAKLPETADWDAEAINKRLFDTAKAAGCRIISYGVKPTDDVRAEHIEKREDGIHFTVITSDFTEEFRITMPGLFNVSNALAAIAMAREIGVPVRYMKEALVDARAEGRMESYHSEDGKVIAIVDYAHNTLSFEELFKSVRVEYPTRSIVLVFGCPGKKAENRRKDLSESAARHADFVVVSEEDTADEPYVKIASEIVEHLGDCPHIVIEDRGAAVRWAVMNCPLPDKLILITGKGSETRQKRGTEFTFGLSDIDHAKNALRDYDETVRRENAAAEAEA